MASEGARYLNVNVFSKLSFGIFSHCDDGDWKIGTGEVKRFFLNLLEWRVRSCGVDMQLNAIHRHSIT